LIGCNLHFASRVLTLSSQRQHLRFSTRRRAIATRCCCAGESWRGSRFSKDSRGSPPPSSPGGPGAASLRPPGPWINKRIKPRCRHGIGGVEAGEWGSWNTIWIWRRGPLSSRPRRRAGSCVQPHRTAAATDTGRHRPGRGCSLPQPGSPHTRRFRLVQAAG